MTTAFSSIAGRASEVVSIAFRDFDAPPMVRAQAVRAMIARRRLRDSYFPGDLFADPAWDILLELTAAKIDRQPVPISALCFAAAVPTTTALRHINALEERKLVIRRPDPGDRRRVFIELTPAAFEAMLAYLES